MSRVALFAALLMGCRMPAPGLVVRRPPGVHRFEFVSRQVSPAGTSSVRVKFTLRTDDRGAESALVTGYERALGDAPFQEGELSAECRARLGQHDGVLTELPITPPPSRLSGLVPDCVPEDFFGAASDILPLLMIQMQSRFRAGELKAPGDHLRFGGYVAAWQLPPAVLDARVAADSGIVALDTLTPARAIIRWDTSPMRVDIVRQLGPGQRGLLTGREWFVAALTINPRTGELMGAHTVTDSLALHLVLPWPDSTVPAPSARPSGGSGPALAVHRSLELRAMP